MQIGRRTLLGGMAAAGLAGPVLARDPGTPSWYRRAIIIDGQSGIDDPYVPDNQTRISDRAWAAMQRSGVTAVCQTVLPIGNVPDPWGEFQRQFDHVDDVVINANPDRLTKVLSTDDLKAAKRSGRIGVIYDTQDTAMIGESLDRLAEMKKRGIRIVQLTYNLRNLSGDGSLEPGNAGLSKLGHSTIEAIEKEKLLLDLSHGGVRTIAEAISAAKRPFTISHTGSRNLNDNPRNVWDESIKAVAEKGGIVGIYFTPFLVASSRPTTEDLLRHIDHVAKLVGEDHISIGTDSVVAPWVLNEETRKRIRDWRADRIKRGVAAPGEGIDVLPFIEDLDRADRLQVVATALAKRGWSETRLEKLFGANLMRLYGEVWG